MALDNLAAASAAALFVHNCDALHQTHWAVRARRAPTPAAGVTPGAEGGNAAVVWPSGRRCDVY